MMISERHIDEDTERRWYTQHILNPARRTAGLELVPIPDGASATPVEHECLDAYWAGRREILTTAYATLQAANIDVEKMTTRRNQRRVRREYQQHRILQSYEQDSPLSWGTVTLALALGIGIGLLFGSTCVPPVDPIDLTHDSAHYELESTR